MPILRLGLAALAACAVVSAGPVLAKEGKSKEAEPEEEAVGAHEQVFPAPEGGRKGEIRISAVRIRYPGLPEKMSCRVEFFIANTTDKPVAFSGLFRAYKDAKRQREVDAWFVSASEIKPGTMQSRVYSCQTPQYVQIDRTSVYGWPQKCGVDGASPCDVAVRVDSNMVVLSN
jgi:hypothetical protein